MRRPKHQVTSEEDLFVGIDLHKDRWHLTIRTMDLESPASAEAYYRSRSILLSVVTSETGF